MRIQEGARLICLLQIISDASEGQTVWRYGGRGGGIQKNSTSLNISAGRQSMRWVHDALSVSSKMSLKNGIASVFLTLLARPH